MQKTSKLISTIFSVLILLFLCSPSGPRPIYEQLGNDSRFGSRPVWSGNTGAYGGNPEPCIALQTAQSGANGAFEFHNVPYNNYHVSVAASGFQAGHQDVDVRSAVAVEVKISLAVGAAETNA